jgi:glycosyltransferase involved in cell wall biosynthesis
MSQNTALVIVGDGPQRDDITAAIRANTQGVIHLAGYVPYKHLPIYYAMADVFIHPAHRECWGVSVNEAMVCGLPVLTADTVGAAADLVEEGVNGYSYPCGDIEALHELMRRCLTHRDNLNAMGRRSQSKIAGWGAKETAERLADWAMHRI